MRTNWLRAAGIGAVFAVIAAACGGDEQKSATADDSSADGSGDATAVDVLGEIGTSDSTTDSDGGGGDGDAAGPIACDDFVDAGADAASDADTDADANAACVSPCDAPLTCGGGGVSGTCGCTKVTCAQRGKNCGMISDGCGGTLYCGTCAANETCGASCTNTCRCVPKTCPDQKKNCGVIPDGCGKTFDCGPCATGICGANNICGVAENLFIYGNYDGGTFTIDVDQNLPNIGIGLVSYKPVTVTITGTYASNVVAVYHAGAQVGSTFTGVSAGIVTNALSPQATIQDPPGASTIYCHDSGGANYSGGSCNTKKQVRDFFERKLGGQIVAHRCQYDAYSGTITTSSGGTCACTPFTCQELGKDCGKVADGCGGEIDCGTCPNGTICGAFGEPNICAACPPGQTFAGPRSPSILIQDSSLCCSTWLNPGRASLSDNSYAEVSAMTNGAVSAWLKATGFGFTIPPTATIKGVYVEWERSGLSGSGLKDFGIRLVANDAIGATDRSKPDVWGDAIGTGSTAIDRKVMYGGASDLWGETGLTPAIVNAANFGAALSVKYTSVSGNDWPQVDAARMWVCYE